MHGQKPAADGAKGKTVVQERSWLKTLLYLVVELPAGIALNQWAFIVFARSLSCEPVRKVGTREECHWSHACKSFKRAGAGTNGILECKFLPENAHRTSRATASNPMQFRLCL
jgi:hypothetical protein